MVVGEQLGDLAGELETAGRQERRDEADAVEHRIISSIPFSRSWKHCARNDAAEGRSRCTSALADLFRLCSC